MTQPSRQPSQVLVTGAAGFIGSRLVRHLLSTAPEDARIVALTMPNSRRGHPAAGLRSISGDSRLITFGADLTDALTLKSLGGESKDGPIDTVFHLAAATPDSRASRETSRKVNLDGTKNLFNAVRESAKHFVYVSGLAIFKPGPESESTRVVNEDSPKDPSMEYIRIRLEAEEYLRENCVAAGIGFTAVYMPDVVYGNGGSFREIFLERISRGSFRVPGSGRYYANFIHLDDAANILATIGSKRNVTAGQSYIASDSEPAPFRDFVNCIADELKVKRPGSAPLFLAKAVVGSDLIGMLTKDTRASNEKIRKLVELKHSSFRTGIPQVVSEFKSGH